MKKLEAIIEAILFANGEPLELTRIANAIDIETDTTEKLLSNRPTGLKRRDGASDC
jgi:chromosome segregation and condensation protein ScpB